MIKLEKHVRNEEFEKIFEESNFNSIQIDLNRIGNEILSITGVRLKKPEISWHWTREYRIVLGDSIIFTKDIIGFELVEPYILHLIVGGKTNDDS
jgi:hypothetical protein